MSDYQIQAPTRRCVVSGRELRPGDRFHAVLRDRDGKFVREDYAVDAWPGPPEGTIAHWVGRVATTAESLRKMPVDDDMLFECFQRLDGASEADRIRFRYVVALLLMRRKRFRFDDVIRDATGEYLSLRCTKTGETFRVLDPGLTEEQMISLEDEVVQAFGMS